MRLSELFSTSFVVAGEVSLCCIRLAEDRFAFDTSQVREVLGKYEIRHVPLAPRFILGITPYCGGVLTTLSLRALLGRSTPAKAGTVLVLQDEKTNEPWGLMVDAADGVISVSNSHWQPNRATLNAPSQYLFDGSYTMSSGSMVHLDAERFHPGRLVTMEIFQNGKIEEASCEH